MQLFYKHFHIILVLLLSTIVASCAPAANNRMENIVPRESFVRIVAEAKAEMCFVHPETKKEICDTTTMKAYASGVIVDRKGSDSKVLTAGHVCDTDDLADGIPNVKSIKVRLLVIAKNGQVFESKIIRIDPTIDCCLLDVGKMNRWRPIRIRKSPPKYGEMFYNMASPLGTAGDEMTPFLQGRYAGVVNFRRAAYMIPAAPGSSGSPVFDRKGKLVGMIHSVYIRFPFLAFSPTHEKLMDFLER